MTTSTSECSDGNSFTLLNYTRATFASSAAVATGRVVGCRNSRYVDICADDSSDMSDLERIAQRACDYITSSEGCVIFNKLWDCAPHDEAVIYCLLNKTHINDNYLM